MRTDTLINIPVIILAITLIVLAVLFCARRFHWSRHTRLTLIAAAFPLGLILSVVILVLLGLLGALIPLEATIAHWKIEAIEHRLHRGENRVAFERQIAKSFAAPFEQGVCNASANSYGGRDTGADRRCERYFYLEASSLCVATYKGIEVQYDLNNDVKSWKDVGWYDGC